MKKSNTFVEITNQDIYNELKLNRELNAKEHNAIVTRLDYTNGKVKLNKWIATTAMSLVLITITILINHIGK